MEATSFYLCGNTEETSADLTPSWSQIEIPGIFVTTGGNVQGESDKKSSFRITVLQNTPLCKQGYEGETEGQPRAIKT